MRTKRVSWFWKFGNLSLESFGNILQEFVRGLYHDLRTICVWFRSVSLALFCESISSGTC